MIHPSSRLYAYPIIITICKDMNNVTLMNGAAIPGPQVFYTASFKTQLCSKIYFHSLLCSPTRLAAVTNQ